MIIIENGIPTLYSQKYDALYNADTGEWLEKKCSDTECEFCANRPDNAIEELKNE